MLVIVHVFVLIVVGGCWWGVVGGGLEDGICFCYNITLFCLTLGNSQFLASHFLYKITFLNLKRSNFIYNLLQNKITNKEQAFCNNAVSG